MTSFSKNTFESLLNLCKFFFVVLQISYLFHIAFNSYALNYVFFTFCVFLNSWNFPKGSSEQKQSAETDLQQLAAKEIIKESAEFLEKATKEDPEKEV